MECAAACGSVVLGERGGAGYGYRGEGGEVELPVPGSGVEEEGYTESEDYAESEGYAEGEGVRWECL